MNEKLENINLLNYLFFNDAFHLTLSIKPLNLIKNYGGFNLKVPAKS